MPLPVGYVERERIWWLVQLMTASFSSWKYAVSSETVRRAVYFVLGKLPHWLLDTLTAHCCAKWVHLLSLGGAVVLKHFSLPFCSQWEHWGAAIYSSPGTPVSENILKCCSVQMLLHSCLTEKMFWFWLRGCGISGICGCGMVVLSFKRLE